MLGLAHLPWTSRLKVGVPRHPREITALKRAGAASRRGNGAARLAYLPGVGLGRTLAPVLSENPSKGSR